MYSQFHGIIDLQEEYRTKLTTLEQQVACLEDELCESRLNASKLNTELISEKSSAEVRLAEMQSKLNEVRHMTLNNDYLKHDWFWMKH